MAQNFDSTVKTLAVNLLKLNSNFNTNNNMNDQDYIIKNLYTDKMSSPDNIIDIVKNTLGIHLNWEGQISLKNRKVEFFAVFTGAYLTQVMTVACLLNSQDLTITVGKAIKNMWRTYMARELSTTELIEAIKFLAAQLPPEFDNLYKDYLEPYRF